MIFPQATIYLGAEGLLHTLRGVRGPRQGRLGSAFAKGARELAEWFLWRRDPLRKGWATPGSRLDPGAVRERVLARRDAPDFDVLGEFEYELLDPALTEWVVDLWSSEPGEVLPAFPATGDFRPRDDEAGLWRRGADLYSGNRERMRLAILGLDPGPSDFDFNF
tara:strand:+ start:1121 stop:1612 length:492 start_codon:yes stop_codon:yes gene_type:complete